MRSTEEIAPGRAAALPRWVSWTLIAGALGLLAWAWVVRGFLSEPSATGRVRALLVAWAVFSALAALLGAGAALGALRATAWARLAGWIAGAAMTLTVVGAIAGVPALLGLLWSRRPASS
ncbi:MAG TPA: hypothetical protein VEW68_02875 [Patescibacteria group bacterium]|nr:hypothetical protein [Patescibacteria group bacterium]